jgi:hypothetical protein
MKIRNSLYNVKTKGGLLNLKINPRTREEFKIAAELRGATMSSLLHQHIFQVIREEKREHPEAFAHLGADSSKEPQPPTPKVIQSRPRKRDRIDEAIDAALAYGGGPISDIDRQRIREILEKQDKESKESP